MHKALGRTELPSRAHGEFAQEQAADAHPPRPRRTATARHYIPPIINSPQQLAEGSPGEKDRDQCGGSLLHAAASHPQAPSLIAVSGSRGPPWRARVGEWAIKESRRPSDVATRKAERPGPGRHPAASTPELCLCRKLGLAFQRGSEGESGYRTATFVGGRGAVGRGHMHECIDSDAAFCQPSKVWEGACALRPFGG